MHNWGEIFMYMIYHYEFDNTISCYLCQWLSTVEVIKFCRYVCVLQKNTVYVQNYLCCCLSIRHFGMKTMYSSTTNNAWASVSHLTDHFKNVHLWVSLPCHAHKTTLHSLLPYWLAFTFFYLFSWYPLNF